MRSGRRFPVGYGTGSAKSNFPAGRPVPRRSSGVARGARPLGRAGRKFYFSSGAPDAHLRSGYESYASVKAVVSRFKIFFFFPRHRPRTGRRGRRVPVIARRTGRRRRNFSLPVSHPETADRPWPLCRVEIFFSRGSPGAHLRSGYASYASVTAVASRLKIFFFPRVRPPRSGHGGRRPYRCRGGYGRRDGFRFGKKKFSRIE